MLHARTRLRTHTPGPAAHSSLAQPACRQQRFLPWLLAFLNISFFSLYPKTKPGHFIEQLLGCYHILQNVLFVILVVFLIKSD